MARSNPAPAASRRELETIALIGSRRDLLWQLADEARGYENFATVVADQGLHDEPFDVQVDAFISFVNERVTHGDAAPDWTALEDTYGERADTIIEGARSATPVAMEVVLYFPAGDGPDGQETLAVGGVTVYVAEGDGVDVFELAETPVAGLEGWVDHVGTMRGWNRLNYTNDFGDHVIKTLAEGLEA